MLGRAGRSAFASVMTVVGFVLWPTPAEAVARFDSAFRLSAMLCYTVGLGVWAAVFFGFDLIWFGVALTLAGFALERAQKTRWHQGRVADYKSACVEDGTGDYAFDREERRAIYNGLRTNRTILKYVAMRDKQLALVADNLSFDLANAEDHKVVSFLANLGNVVLPSGCTWRMQIQHAAGIARSRIYDRAARASPDVIDSKA